jgi:diaminohydroxyphosphoribosylaminopyrimidine deaminase / 5-amino-6-(5-phosphoribosylamino)uracil reductase
MTDIDHWHMRRALELAVNGEGYVEPNPMVGCVIARGAEIIGEGWHRRFGGPHAEIEALRLAGSRAGGATMYVTLEPCCHFGKTPPCTKAIIAAGIKRVVVAQSDPFPQFSDKGLAELRAAGIEVEVGLLEGEAGQLNAPYLKLIKTCRPWIIAKWAMSLDGKMAAASGESRWISNEKSRAAAHKIRGRMDAIIVGRETALLDDPLLTARPPGPRTVLRVVLDTQASLSVESQLARTAKQIPVLVAVGNEASQSNRQQLQDAGCEVFLCSGDTHVDRLHALLDELGRRRMTNVLVEGGGKVLGSLLDARQIDEVHVFIAPKLIGGAGTGVPFAGVGIAQMADVLHIDTPVVENIDGDAYIHGRIIR